MSCSRHTGVVIFTGDRVEIALTLTLCNLRTVLNSLLAPNYVAFIHNCCLFVLLTRGPQDCPLIGGTAACSLRDGTAQPCASVRAVHCSVIVKRARVMSQVFQDESRLSKQSRDK